jgi:hypothetical protein
MVDRDVSMPRGICPHGNAPRKDIGSFCYDLNIDITRKVGFIFVIFFFLFGLCFLLVMGAIVFETR